MDDDFDNGMGLPDEEIGGSIDDLADVAAGGIEGDVEPGVGEAGGTRSSGGARARLSPAPRPRAAKTAAPAKKSSKPKAAPAKKKKPAKKAAKKKAAKKKAKSKKPARKAARKSGRKAAKRKK